MTDAPLTPHPASEILLYQAEDGRTRVGELRPEATVANFATVAREGEREVARDLDHYNLDVIISVGYRVKSHRGTQILQHAGTIAHEAAVARAEREYDRFSAQRAALPAPVERDFEEAVREVKQIEKKRPAGGKGSKKR
jgi:hypothetical protein